MTLSEQNDETPHPALTSEPGKRVHPDGLADLAGAALRRAAYRGGDPYRAVGELDRGRYLRVQAFEDAIDCVLYLEQSVIRTSYELPAKCGQG
jgi:hypothetical protein